MQLRPRLAAAALALAAFATACSGSDSAEQFDTFTKITDCRELERLASVEVDRINTSGDADVVEAATNRFQRIVAHRDSIC